MKPIYEWSSEETARVWKKFKVRGIRTKEDLEILKKVEKRHLELTGHNLPKVFVAKELK